MRIAPPPSCTVSASICLAGEYRLPVLFTPLIQCVCVSPCKRMWKMVENTRNKKCFLLPFVLPRKNKPLFFFPPFTFMVTRHHWATGSLISGTHKKKMGQTQIDIPREMFGNSSVFVIHLQLNTDVCTQLHPIHQIHGELRLQRVF